MSVQKTMTIEDNAEGVEAVVNFLREHPSLLVEHPDLLSEMIIPHATGVATSLVERQVSVLREQVRQYKHQLQDLVEIATENGLLNERLHLLAVKLIESTDLASLIACIKRTLVSDFKADKIVLKILAEHSENKTEFVGLDWPEKNLFTEAFKQKKPLCGRLKEDQHKTMFADELPEYGSSVLIPLFGNDWSGLLTIGSQNPERYQEDMGTEILTQMADIVTLALNSHVNPNIEN